MAWLSTGPLRDHLRPEDWMQVRNKRLRIREVLTEDGWNFDLVPDAASS